MRILKKLSILFVIAIVMLTACRNTIPIIVPNEPTPNVPATPSISAEEAAKLTGIYIDSISFNNVKDVAKALVSDYAKSVADSVSSSYSSEINSIKTIINTLTSSTNMVTALLNPSEEFKTTVASLDEFVSDMPSVKELLDSLETYWESEGLEKIQALAYITSFYTAITNGPSGGSSEYAEDNAALYDKIATDVANKIIKLLDEILLTASGSYNNNYTLSITGYTLTADQLKEIFPVLLATEGYNDAPLNIPVSLTMDVTSEPANSDIFKDDTEYQGTVTMTIDFNIVNEQIPGDYDLCIKMGGVTVSTDGNLKVQSSSDSKPAEIALNGIYAAINAYVDIDLTLPNIVISLEDKTINENPASVTMTINTNGSLIDVKFKDGSTTASVIYSILDLDEAKGTVTYNGKTVPFAEVLEATDQGKN